MKKTAVALVVLAIIGAGWSWGGDASPNSTDSGSTIIAGH